VTTCKYKIEEEESSSTGGRCSNVTNNPTK